VHHHANRQYHRPPSSFQESPLEQVKLVFVRFLQGLFYYRPPGALHWDPDEQLTEIVICDDDPIEVSRMSFRPAITVTLGPVALSSMGMDDTLSHNLRTGAKTRGVLVPGTLQINCVSSVKDESAAIAWFCGESVCLLREMLLRQGFFDVGRNVGIGVPTPAGALIAGDSGGDLYATTASCPFHFQRTGIVTPLSNPNKRFVPQGDVYEGAMETDSSKAMVPGRDPTEWEVHDPVMIAREVGLLPFTDLTPVQHAVTDPPSYLSDSLPILPDPLNPTKSPVAVMRIVATPSTPSSSSIRTFTLRGRRIPIR